MQDVGTSTCRFLGTELGSEKRHTLVRYGRATEDRRWMSLSQPVSVPVKALPRPALCSLSMAYSRGNAVAACMTLALLLPVADTSAGESMPSSTAQIAQCSLPSSSWI